VAAAARRTCAYIVVDVSLMATLRVIFTRFKLALCRDPDDSAIVNFFIIVRPHCLVWCRGTDECETKELLFEISIAGDFVGVRLLI